MSQQTLGHLAMLTFSALVAGSFSLGSLVANDISPMALTAVRFVIATLIIAVAAFNLVSALTMVVTDKTREIAILKSMGATSQSAARIFRTIGVLIGAAGTLLGLALGLTLCSALSRFDYALDPNVYRIDRLPVQVNLGEIGLIVAITMVIAAIATISVQAVVQHMGPFLIVVGAGILWNIFCVVVLARRMLPDAWFERSIAEMGQSMGITATGLLLLRVVDPDYETPAADAFASKQLLHEPFMGGGLWTAMAIPLLATVGPVPVFLIATGAVTVVTGIIFLPRWRRGT